MAARALDKTGERHLVLDYLLGAPMKVLVEAYGIPRATIYRIFKRHEIEVDRKKTRT